jgi:hypothetical protein
VQLQPTIDDMFHKFSKIAYAKVLTFNKILNDVDVSVSCLVFVSVVDECGLIII